MRDKEKSAEALAIYFEETKEVRAAHLLYDDLRAVRPDVSKFEFYLLAQDARDGFDGVAEDGNLGWTLKLKQTPEKENFFDAVRNDETMPEDQKKRWLDKEG